MEAVKAFNDELFSIQEGRGPISRAKMAKITSIAIKAVKFYKHVVHGVEKFIHKSSTEHKIPGLYVMDSIIRQSIHRFGSDKDVFAARFSKNIFTTFENLLQCKEDEKVKIVRVLQLWQKNAAFSNDLIQKLIELIEKSSEATQPDLSQAVDMSITSNEDENAQETNSKQLDSSKILSSVCQMLQSDKAVQINQLLQQVASNHPQLLPQLSQIIQLSENQSSSSSQQASSENQSAWKPSNLDSNVSSIAMESSTRDANWSREDEENTKYQSWASKSSTTRHDTSTSQGDHYSDQSQRLIKESEEAWNEEGNYWNRSRTDSFGNNSRNWSEHENVNFRKRRRSDDRGSDERSQRSRSREKRRRSRSRERSYRSSSRDRYESKNKRPLEHLAIRPNNVLISSTTLWIGHLNKHTTEDELKAELSNYGTLTSINLIPPRGCAFVTYSTRSEALKALERARGRKFNNYVLKVAWAIGSGMKESEMKEFWDLEQGVSFIPWDRLDDTWDLDALAEGGYLHEESLPQELMKALTERRQSIPAEKSRVDPQEASSTSGTMDSKSVVAQSTIPPPCFTHFPPPLPGMPPLLPPAVMMGLPPPMIHSGVPTPMAMVSPVQGNQSEASTPSSNSNKPHSEVPFVTPSYPPPPLPAWNPPGVRLPPPMPFPPPVLPLRPVTPQQSLNQSFESESNLIENPEEGVESEFNQGQMYHGGNPRPWGFNGNRGGRRGSYRNNYNCDDGSRQFTPNKFGQRHGHDHHHQHHYNQQHHYRGKNNWNNNRGQYKKNFRQNNWAEEANEYEEEKGEEFYSEGEGGFNQQRNDGWSRDYQRHQGQKWNSKRDNRWGNEDQGGRGYHRGGQSKWYGAQRDNNNSRWNNNNVSGQSVQWEDQRNYYQHSRMPHHGGVDLKSIEERYQVRGSAKSEERYQMRGSAKSEESSSWTEPVGDEGGAKVLNSSSSDCMTKEESFVSKEEEVKKRLKKSRWDDDDDCNEGIAVQQSGGAKVESND